MRSYPTVWISAVWAMWLLSVQTVEAQNYQRVQPIVLMQSTACCQSPADTASQPVCLPAGDRTYLPLAERDPLTVIPVASQLTPLPTPQQWRGYEGSVDTVIEYPTPVVNGVGPQSVTVLRPAPVAQPAPEVPDGYVVGSGLIGQPKLYKPGQPIRNFLRYISL